MSWGGASVAAGAVGAVAAGAALALAVVLRQLLPLEVAARTQTFTRITNRTGIRKLNQTYKYLTEMQNQFGKKEI